MTGRVLLAIALVLVIFFAGAFLVYGGFSALAGLKPPAGASPAVFLTSVLVVKLGHAIAFVLLFYLARGSLRSGWLAYAFVWWLMFVVGEVGQAMGPAYSWLEALAGILSETLYFPGAAWVTSRLLGTP